MDQYDIHVNLVMEFLKTNGYSASVISAHRICYKELRRYLASTHTSYTLSESLAWLENNQNAWTYRMYTSRRLCIYQLEDVYISGTVSPDHLGPHASAYTMLIPELQEELDDFINNDQHVYGDGRYRISCSRFLYYLQKRAITSISQLNYELLLTFMLMIIIVLQSQKMFMKIRSVYFYATVLRKDCVVTDWQLP